MSIEIQQGFTTDPDKSVQGFALYAEFKNAYQQTYQVVITPDGLSENDVFVCSRVYYRTLSKMQPKKQWRTQLVKRNLVDPEGNSTSIFRDYRFESVHWLMKRISISSELVAKPFYVEVSKKDLVDISVGKTPTKVIHRVGQSRIALSYPEMFVA